MRLTIQEFRKGCSTCHEIKARYHKTYGLLQSVEPQKEKWEVIAMDFALLSKTKNDNSKIFNAVGKLSIMIRIVQIKSNVAAPELK